MARSKGSGTLIKKGKYYLAKWIVDGKIYTRSTKCTHKDDALKKLQEFTHPFQTQSNIEKIENLEAKIRSEETALSNKGDEFADCELTDVMTKFYSLANSYKVTESTLYTYTTFHSSFLRFLNERYKNKMKLVKDIDNKVVEGYLSHLKANNISAQRYNCTIAFFKKMWTEFGRLSKHKCFKKNPWMNFRYQTFEESYKRELTVEELSKVLQATVDNERLNLLFCIGIYTGLRKSDCCSLKWCEVDLIKNTITKIPKKTRKSRRQVVIPIHEVLRNKLIYHRQLLEKKIADGTAFDEDKEYVSHDLYRICQSNVLSREIGKVFKKVGIKTSEVIDGKKRTIISFHSLRHSFVSMAASAGIPLNVVKNLVGHTSSKMTEHYEHISTLSLMNAVKQLPNVINENVRQKVNIEVDAEIVSKISQITSKSISEILNDFILANDPGSPDDVITDIMDL